jgi:tRNA-Thr(GGU) m(6)t(6)A37 methyltransferase TsaA
MRNSDAVLTAITTVAIISSILSWRRQVLHAEKELNKSSMQATMITIKNRTKEQDRDGLTVHPIGTIRSVYRLCVGTPRQGLLAPSARGCIQLHKVGDASTAEAVSGLEGFSHIWIIFVFHLNTQSPLQQRRFKSKISPPALGGKKVGVYATRSPHRSNPIGITLCRLDSIQVDGPHQVTLQISGLDLVDGTPVLDIKPYVPVYDSVHPTHLDVTSSAASVPAWVDGGLKTSRRVRITDRAKEDLRTILRQDPQALDFYGPHRGDDDIVTTHKHMMDCIRQVLAMDVRSSFQTQKTRKGEFQAERAQRVQAKFGQGDNNKTTADGKNIEKTEIFCSQQLDNLIIEYQVKEAENLKREASENSGAEDLIVVKKIRLLQNHQGRCRTRET